MKNCRVCFFAVAAMLAGVSESEAQFPPPRVFIGYDQDVNSQITGTTSFFVLSLRNTDSTEIHKTPAPPPGGLITITEPSISQPIVTLYQGVQYDVVVSVENRRASRIVRTEVHVPAGLSGSDLILDEFQPSIPASQNQPNEIGTIRVTANQPTTFTNFVTGQKELGYGVVGFICKAKYEGSPTLRVGQTFTNRPSLRIQVIPIGDANHDGVFDSSDFVTIFQAGLYETGHPATFEQGDFNHDGVFNSSDFVYAIAFGNFEG